MIIFLISLIGLIWLSVSIYNFLSGRKLIRDFIHYYKLSSKSLKEWDQYCSNNQNQSDVIVSLSTIPSRIAAIGPTLKSLLSQSVKPASIHIYIPDFSEREQTQYVISNELQGLKNVQIKHSEKDWGPATKFIPAINTLDQSTRILVVDDDNLYPKGYIQCFLEASEKYPDSIVAASGWQVPKDLTDKSTTLWSNIMQVPPTPVLCTRISQPQPTDVIQGYSGYLLRPSFFDIADLTDYQGKPEAARYVDDVWVSAHAKVQKIIFPMMRLSYSVFWKQKFYKSTSLAKINNWNRERNEDRNNSVMIRFFKDKWLFNRS